MSAVHHDRRWPALRLAAKRRDGWKCVGTLPDGDACGARGRLEVDHIKRARLRPDLAYNLDNLQTLCIACHIRKSRAELGLRSDPTHAAWNELVRQLQLPSKKETSECWNQ
ncbi:HNH endonuclease [Reyranella sp.]|uniref:HNH endonuclease n=1 Tax=Reyranella sp. TaxID=1929291 RepID=UPI0037841946